MQNQLDHCKLNGQKNIDKVALGLFVRNVVYIS